MALTEAARRLLDGPPLMVGAGLHLGYEPLWAIGSEAPAPVEHVTPRRPVANANGGWVASGCEPPRRRQASCPGV